MNFGFSANKCKTQCKLCVGRIKLMRNKRSIMLKQQRREVAELLRNNKQENARIRVEAVMHEENLLQAYEVLELFLELLSVRVALVERNKEMPPDMIEAISSLVYAGTRVQDFPELLAIRSMLSSKYGKEYATEASSDVACRKWHVNENLIRCLAIDAPAPEDKLACLSEIAQQHGVEWDAAGAAQEMLPGNRPFAGRRPGTYVGPGYVGDAAAGGGSNWAPPPGAPPPQQPPPPPTPGPDGTGGGGYGGPGGGGDYGGPGGGGGGASGHYPVMATAAAPASFYVNNQPPRQTQQQVSPVAAQPRPQAAAPVQPQQPAATLPRPITSPPPAAAAAPGEAVGAAGGGAGGRQGFNSVVVRPGGGQSTSSWAPPPQSASPSKSVTGHLDTVGKWKTQMDNPSSTKRLSDASSSATNIPGDIFRPPAEAPTMPPRLSPAPPSSQPTRTADGYVVKSDEEIRREYDAAPGPPSKSEAQASGPPSAPPPPPVGNGEADLNLPSPPLSAPQPPQPAAAVDELDELTKRFEMLKRR